MAKKLITIMLSFILCMVSACSDDKEPTQDEYGVKVEIPSESPDMMVFEKEIVGRVWIIEEMTYLTTDFLSINPDGISGGGVVFKYFASADKFIVGAGPESLSTLYNVEYNPENGDVELVETDKDGNVLKGFMFRIVKFDGLTLWTLKRSVNLYGETTQYTLLKFTLSDNQDWTQWMKVFKPTNYSITDIS